MASYLILTLKDLEREHILKSLSLLNGNRTHTAIALDISLRTLRNKLNLYRKQKFFVMESKR